MASKSIIFISPDYHCSFFYRDELRKLGWKADIYVSNIYPRKLLYSDKDILLSPGVNIGGRLGLLINVFLRCLIYLAVIMRYKYHLYYGGIDQFSFYESKLGLTRLFGESFRLQLWLAKLFKRKIIQLPSGCLEEESRTNISKLDNGNVCDNCGWSQDVCCDEKSALRFEIIRRYADMVIGYASLDSSQYKATHFKYKSIDLDLWKPDLEIPDEYMLPPTENLRILHSFYKKDREHDGKNIKGSPFILDAIERLRKEGHKVEYMYITDVTSRDMRYFQAQADIVVEQLIYGWWGSTGVEVMTLGKPTVCYLRPSWKKFFLEIFPEYDDLPIVEATTSSIYDVLKKLVTDCEYRTLMGKKGRQFAEQHFDLKKNAAIFAEKLLQL